MAIDLSNYVRVTHHHPHTIKGRFDGEDFEFKPGQPEDIHVAAARHIFGFGVEDKAPALARLGVVSTSDQMSSGLKFLSGFKFESVPDIASGTPDTTPRSAGGDAPDANQAASGEEPVDADDEGEEEEIPPTRASRRR